MNLIEEWKNSLITEKVHMKYFQSLIDEIINDYEAKENQIKEDLSKKNSNIIVDEEGFILVQSKKNKRPLEDRLEQIQSSTKKNSIRNDNESHLPEGIKNFYRFQNQNIKLDQLKELKNKFEQDKKRIAKMKERRKYGNL